MKDRGKLIYICNDYPPVKRESAVQLVIKQAELKCKGMIEENYYIDEIDKIIRDKDESIIGNLYKSISDNKDKDLRLKISDIEYMRYIFFLQYFRNNAFSKMLESKVKYIDKKTMHNISIASLINYLETGKPEKCNKKK